MKTKLLTIFRSALLLTVILSTAFSSQAFDFEVDGIYYNRTSDNTVEVTYKDTNFDSYSGDITIPATISHNGTTYSVTSIGVVAFDRCAGLTSINIPNSVTSIEFGAFGGCEGLTSITIPNSVTSISAFSFNYCTGLTNIDIPNSITSIGDHAFYYCTGLTSINIPNSITSIGERAFYECTGLTSITIPSSVISIGLKAFGFCSGLSTITVDDGNAAYDSRDNCNAIIKTVTGTLVTGCKNTVIPSSVTSIGESAFSGCSGLTSIEIPNSVTSIGNFAFQRCTGLTSVIIPNSVISDFDNPGIAMFYQCTGLTSITIGSGITWMGETFLECPNITRETCLSSTPPYPQTFVTTIDGDIFSQEVIDHATLYVPAESLESYQQHSYWNQFQNILPIGEGGTPGPGDVNCDGEINIADVNAIIDIVLGGSDNSQGRSDVNNDGEVNIADVNAIINIILL